LARHRGGARGRRGGGAARGTGGRVNAAAMPLAEAVKRFVEPCMHLHFASTPARSNAAVREVARAFRGARPRFTLSTTGFHSTAHLLGLLRLGQRYVACFFGDNYPAPRPNRLYADLEDEGAALEHWSLWTYVSALRAGALGHGWAVTTSLAGTSLGDGLARAGRFAEVPDPAAPVERRLGLVAAMRPDVTFLHAAAADAEGNVLLSPPYAEGVWGALAARRGVVATVEGAPGTAAADTVRGAVHVPAHRVLAICVEPFGAHPSYVQGAYDRDNQFYLAWDAITKDEDALQAWLREWVYELDGRAAYREKLGEDRVASLRPGAAPSGSVDYGRYQ